jgi:hypothetical protein
MMLRTDLRTTRIVIDKLKVKERMDMLGIQSYRALAESTDALGDERISERSLYNIIGNDKWHSKMLYALAEVLDCSPLDLLTAMIDQGKALAPVELASILRPR